MGVAARLRRVGRYDALALTALVWFLAKFLRYAFPPLFPGFRAEFGVSNALLGAAYTAMMTVYALMQFPSGALADRLDATRVIVGGGLVAAAGALWLVVPVTPAPVALPLAGAVPAGFLALVAGMLLVGLGTGAHKTAAVRLLSRVHPARTGRALGVLDTFGAFGGVAAGQAVVVFTDLGSWHALFLAGGVAGVCLAAAVAIRVPRRVPPAPAADDGDDPATGPGYLALFRDRRFVVFVLVTLFFSFAYNGAVAFLPSFLVAAGGLDSETANLLYSGLFVVSLVQLLTGDLSDRVGHLPVIAATLTLAAVAVAALVAVGAAGPVVLGGLLVAFGLGSHGFRPVRGAYLTAVIPEDVAGGGLGVVRTFLMGAGAVAPAVVGVVADARGFRAAFGLLAASIAVAALLTGVVALIGE